MRRLSLCVLVVVLVAAGCGSDEGTEEAGEGSARDTESEASEPDPSVATASDGVDAAGPAVLVLGGLPDEATVVASGREVHVSWPEAAPVAGSSAAGYEVQWRSGGEDWDDSRRRVVLGLSYVIGGLVDGEAYTVRVRPAEVETASVAGASITAGKGSAPTAEIVEDAAPLPGAYQSVSALGSAVSFEMTGEPVWPATITMPVDLSLIDDDSEVFFAYFNESLQAWALAATGELDRQRGVVTAEVYHLSDWLSVLCSILCQTATPIGGPQQIQSMADFVRDQWDHTIGWLKEGWHLAEDFVLEEIAQIAQQVLVVAREMGRRLSPWVEALLDAAALVTLLPHHAKTLLDVLAGKFGYDIDPPSCAGARPSWARPTVMQPRKDVLLSCDETAAGGDDLGVKLTVNRTYALMLEPEERSVQIGPASSQRISVEAIDLPTDLEDLLGAAIYRLVDGDGVYLSPGATTTLRIPQSAMPATRTSDTTQQLSTRLGYSVDTTATLLQTLLLGLDVATGGIAKSLRSADQARRMVVCALDVFAGGTNAIEAGSAQGMVDMIEEVVVDCLAQVLPDLVKEFGPLMVVLAAAVLLHEYGRMVADGVLSVGDQHVVVSSKNLQTPTELDSGAVGESAALSAGGGHACALRPDSTIACWGANPAGQADSPAGTFIAVSAGDGHTCGLRTDSTIACWGHDPAAVALTLSDRRSEPPEGKFTAVAAGGTRTCALHTNGTVTCWGTHGDDAPDGEFVAIASGYLHTCGIDRFGTAKCWGDNTDGQADPPNGTFKAITAGDFHTCALTTQDRIRCWGNNDHGQTTNPALQLFNFTSVTAGKDHTCGTVPGLSILNVIVCWGNNNHGQTDAPDDNYNAVTAGAGFTCAQPTTGDIQCWGNNTHNQTIPPDEFNATVAPGAPTSATAAGRRSFKAVSADALHSCGLRSDGTITCWGRNDYGETDPPDGAFQALAGTCGIRLDSTIECWGSLRDWRAEQRIPWDPPDGTFSALSGNTVAGYCGLRTDGTIACWGSGRTFDRWCGFAADSTWECWDQNTDTEKRAFSAVAGSFGYNGSCGIRTDGTIACRSDDDGWPRGIFSAVAGSCGIRTDATIECWEGWGEPRPGAPDGTFSAISAGRSFTCGLRTDGTITCWGDPGRNGLGQLDAPSGTFSAISAGDSHTCGLRTDGTIECWGRGDWGQLDVPSAMHGESGDGVAVAVSKGGLGPTSVGPGEGTPCAPNTSTCRYLDVELRGFAAGTYAVECHHDGWGDFRPSTFWTFTITVDSSGSASSNGPCFLNFARLTGNGAYVTVSRPGAEPVASNWLK